MRSAVLAAAALCITGGAGTVSGAVRGEYVEARTAEVFAGGCVMSSEAETVGRQAVLAWRIGSGSHEGVALDGLAVVAAVSGDRNLGIRELGGTAPSRTRAALIVDDRATEVQQQALVRLVAAMTRGLVDEVIDVKAAPIQFSSGPHQITVHAAEARLSVQRHLHHDVNCGAMQWFKPLTKGTDASIGVTDVHSFTGRALGTRWSDPHKRSAFVGSFVY